MIAVGGSSASAIEEASMFVSRFLHEQRGSKGNNVLRMVRRGFTDAMLQHVCSPKHRRHLKYQAFKLLFPERMVRLETMAVTHVPDPLIYEKFCFSIYTPSGIRSRWQPTLESISWRVGTFDFCG